MSQDTELNRNAVTAPRSNAVSRPKLEMDGVSAAWLLFQFSRNTKEKSATHTIRTILPNGELKVVNIEVKCNLEKKGTDGNALPVGLPGAFAQDIFIALMDNLVNQIKLTHGELISKARTVGLKGINLPPSCTEVYFRNKDLAQVMGLSEKHPRITDALHHLHQTHIRIRGCIYHNDKEEMVQHDTYYISSLTTGKIIRQGTDRMEWNKAKFDEVLVRQILHGYIAQMDTEKLLRLSSGAPRKLYTLIAAKLLERKGAKTVVITNDEIINTLRIKKAYFKQLSKRYFQELIDASIVSNYSFAEHMGVEVVVFDIPQDTKAKALLSPETITQQFFEMLQEVSKRDANLAGLLKDPKRCDLDQLNLELILSQTEGELFFGGKLYPRAILVADMLIHNASKGQPIKTLIGLLKTLLKKDELPTTKPGFAPIDERFRKLKADREAVKSVEKARENTTREDQKVQEQAREAWKRYSAPQREKLIQLIQDETFKNTSDDSFWKPQPSFYELRTHELLVTAINQGIPTGDVNALMKWYKSRGSLEASA